MTAEDFKALCGEFATQERLMLFDCKDREYGSEKDKLHANRMMADLLGISLPEVFLALFLKHVCSIVNTIQKHSWDWTWVRRDGTEGFKQRLADARNYLLLLAASIEEIDRRTPRKPEWTVRAD